MKAVIIAAGYGSRLWNETNQIPKTLLPFNEGTILSAIMMQMKMAGISDLAMVVGFNQHYIREYVSCTKLPFKVFFIENTEWDRGNGLSVYKAKDWVKDEPFILSMSDHLVCAKAIKAVMECRQNTNLLMVDPFIESNFDLDDATKVLVNEEFISDIGKELERYNALDCGIFRLNHSFFPAMESALCKGLESISAAMKELILKHKLMAVTLAERGQWLDVDTPEAYSYAKERFTGLAITE